MLGGTILIVVLHGVGAHVGLQKFVRAFISSVLDWTPRKGTRAAAHLPENADDLCEEAFFRIVYCMKWHCIPPRVSH